MIGLLTEVVQQVPLPQSDVEVWGRYLLQTITIIGGFVVSIYTLKKKQDVIETKVDKVTELSEPTGNGFAGKTLESQKRIEGALERLIDRVDRNQEALTKHLEHHLDRESKR